jgi:hypothetical protein
MDFGQLIIAAGVGAVAVMQGLILSQLKSVREIADDAALKVQRHELTLYGPNGDNGLAGESRERRDEERRQFTRRSTDLNQGTA